MTISKDRVKPSPLPDSWKLKEIFATGVVLGGYLALMTVIFFWLMKDTHFFPVWCLLTFSSIKFLAGFFCITVFDSFIFDNAGQVWREIDKRESS